MTLSELLYHCSRPESSSYEYAWREFLTRYKVIIYNFITRRCLSWNTTRLRKQLPDVVNDIASDVFIILNKSINTFKEIEAEEKFIAWLAVICNRAVSHYLKKQFISIINDNSADEYQQFIGSLQMDSRWELYDTVVWKIRDSKAKPGKNLERDINIFLLYLWGDFSIEMITSDPCYRDIGPRVIDNVVNRLRILLKM